MWTSNRKLAAAAGVLALLALLAGDGSSRTTVDLQSLAQEVEREEDHVDALELAEWLRDRRPNLRIIDIRSPAEYADYHLPHAENIKLSEIATAAFRPADVIVLYSEGGTHAAQAWFFLRARGLTSVYFLRGGLNDWLDQVINPVLPANDTPELRRQYERQRELVEYFGGEPSRMVLPGGQTPTTQQKVQRLKRRTC